ncbi:MAG: DUF1924 domain-containing protein [Alteromonadaceae bacterium]|nr:DUF1924 domain-containing protein [Alteromonadaceae bacterium]
MIKTMCSTLLVAILLLTTSHSYANAVSADNIARGKQLWQQKFNGKAPYQQRSCETCHGNNLSKAGKHIRTKKLIKPMALSANSARYTEAKKVQKWFYRNCKWTMGKTCSKQQQADILAYLKSL